jgi:hypothetical protein
MRTKLITALLLALCFVAGATDIVPNPASPGNLGTAANSFPEIYGTNLNCVVGITGLTINAKGFFEGSGAHLTGISTAGALTNLDTRSWTNNTGIYGNGVGLTNVNAVSATTATSLSGGQSNNVYTFTSSAGWTPTLQIGSLTVLTNTSILNRLYVGATEYVQDSAGWQLNGGIRPVSTGSALGSSADAWLGSFTSFTASGIGTITNGMVISSNSWVNCPTLTPGKNFYCSSNGVPHVIWMNESGTLTTNRLVP